LWRFRGDGPPVLLGLGLAAALLADCSIIDSARCFSAFVAMGQILEATIVP
jgi:hypothetical protein